MRRIAAVFAGLALLALGARAADEKIEKKSEIKVNDDGTSHVKTTAKHKQGKVTHSAKAEHKVSKDVMDKGTTETKDVKVERDAPGMKGDVKMEKKETIKRDANGNVIKDEIKEEKK